jgi:hypothetical protein
MGRHSNATVAARSRGHVLDGSRSRPRRHRLLLVISGTLVMALSLVIVLVTSGIPGTGTVTAARYSSAGQIIAALDHAGLRCTGAQTTSPPVIATVSSEASCNLSTSQSPLIDVVPGSLTTAMVLHNSVSTGTEKIWNDVGPDWWIETDHADAQRIQHLLGGRIIGGPWHPPGSQTLTSAQGTSICTDLNTWLARAWNQDMPRFSAQLQADESEAGSTPLGNDLQDLDSNLQTLNSDALLPSPPGYSPPTGLAALHTDCAAYDVNIQESAP